MFTAEEGRVSTDIFHQTSKERATVKLDKINRFQFSLCLGVIFLNSKIRVFSLHLFKKFLRGIVLLKYFIKRNFLELNC